MRILFLSQLVPYPPDAGPKIRSYHTIQYLVQAGHQVTLLAFTREVDDEAGIDHLKRLCHEVHLIPLRRSRVRDAWELAQSTLSKRPFLISRDDFSAMHEKIRLLLTNNSYDAVHADQLWMAQYALAAKNGQESTKTLITVLDQHNSVFLIPQRLSMGSTNPVKQAIYAQESRRLAKYELETCQQFDHVVWVTAEDRQALDELSSSRELFGGNPVIPICVDPQEVEEIPFNSKANRVTFLGGMHWPPNAEGISWFYREVWPTVQKSAPHAVLTVIGKNPPASLVRAGEDEADVEAPGYLQDPTDVLRETAAFIVPLHAGGGMRVKIVDAWSWGLPVVSTTIGAEGIDYTNEQDILIADSPEEFAQAVLSLLQNREHAGKISKAGRGTVEEKYDWRKVYSLWDQIYLKS